MSQLRYLGAIAAIFVSLIASQQISAANWTMSGGDIQNTRSFQGGPINANTAPDLQVKWEYRTVPDTGTANTPFGSVSSTPAVEGKFIYINDLSGNITKLDRDTGTLIWKKNYVNDLSIPGNVVIESRNTPYIKGNLLIVGSNFGLADPLCKVVGKDPAPQVCHTGDGAIVLALNKNTGELVWRKKVDPHPAAKITGSISGTGNQIFVPVGTWEEDWARAYPNIYQEPIDPSSKYPCCSFRGNLVAMDANSGSILWKSYIVNGDDPDHELTPELRALLTPRGFFGSSTYGNNPTIDSARKQIYITSAQTSTAPKVAEECEIARRLTGNPNADIPGLPSGVTCNNLNQKLKNYSNAIIALDMNTGKVKWVFYAHKYDAWNHACAAPDFYGIGFTIPLVFPVPFANKDNCFQHPVGPDLGFGHQPVLVNNVKLPGGGKKDLVVAGNKDGRLFALDASNGKKVWETDIDPGGIYGGMQFGLATDGKRVYTGTTNSRNTARDVTIDFHSAQEFLDVNGFTALGIRTGDFVKTDAAAPIPNPSPSSFVLPFPGPNLIYGISNYPNSYPDADGTGYLPPYLKGPASGPSNLWTLINPPSDVTADGVNVISDGGELKTIAGMVTAIDVASGKILWQRPATDGMQGRIGPASAYGSVTVGNGVLFAGYGDGLGTMVVLDASTGEKLNEFHQMIRLSDNTEIPAGFMEQGPAVVDGTVY